MNKITVRIANILAAAMLLLYFVCILCSFLLQLLAQTLYSFPSGVMLTLTVMLPTVVLLINAIVRAKKGTGKFEAVRQGLMLLICVVWLVLTVVYWIFSLSYHTALMSGQFTSEMISKFSYATTIYNVVIGFIMLFLLISYGLGVMRAKQKWLQIKAELHKPAVVVLILVPNLINLLQTVLNPWLSCMSIDLYVKASRIFMYASFGISTLLSLALVAFILIFGLIIKKQPDTAQDAQPEQAALGPSF